MDHLCTSFLPYPLQSDSSALPDPPVDLAREVFVSVVTNRKGWKSFKDGEAVWPPELEEALLEGLEKYVPRNTRETRNLGRFPMRNRFISEYIYHKTGKRRTPKQVGSRLQQLRDTCAGKKLLELLRPYTPPKRKLAPCSSTVPGQRTPTPRSPTPKNDIDVYSDSGSDTDFPVTPTKATYHFDDPFVGDKSPSTVELNVVWIDLVPPANDIPPQGHVKAPEVQDVLPAHLNNIQLRRQPCHIRDIDPTITLLSRPVISAHSIFCVRMGGTPVFTEQIPLESAGCVTDTTNDAYGSNLYRSALAPGYWERICNSADPTQFMIEHDVQLAATPGFKSPLFSAVYKFRYSQIQGSAHLIPQEPNIGYMEVNDHAMEGRNCSNDVLCNPQFMGSPLETFSQDFGFEDDALLTELNMLRLRRGPDGVVDWPDDHSIGSFAASTASSRYHSASPLSPCISELSTSALYTPSPTLCEAPLSEIAAIQTNPTKDISASYLGYSIEDFFNINALSSPQVFSSQQTRKHLLEV